jgi:hypothetical protein
MCCSAREEEEEEYLQRCNLYSIYITTYTMWKAYHNELKPRILHVNICRRRFSNLRWLQVRVILS